MRVLVVLGTRPEAIKLSPVIIELRKRPAFEVSVCATGQHDEMAKQAMTTFGIVPGYSFEFSRLDNSLVAGMISVLSHLEWVVKEKSWDLVIVQGDTTSALAGALSAFYNHVPVAHVEAGLRTHDKTQPWPEEVNRRLITQIADYHFVPTVRAYGNLQMEGISIDTMSLDFATGISFKSDCVWIVGNTVIDALLWVKEKHGMGWAMHAGYILVTAHRRENWGNGILNICKAIRRLLDKHKELRFVWPMHPNKIIRDVVLREIGDHPHVGLTDPMSYGKLVNQMMVSQIILTDSGGIQEEAPTLNTPVLILRDKTERPEVIECGAAKLVGTDPDRIVAEVTRLLTDKEEYERMASAENPFGDGHAAERIVDALEGQ